jgi:hypothetical protein
MQNPFKYFHILVTRHRAQNDTLLKAHFTTKKIGMHVSECAFSNRSYITSYVDTPKDTLEQSSFEPSSQQTPVLFEHAQPLFDLALPSSNPARRTDNLSVDVRIPKSVDADEATNPLYDVTCNSKGFFSGSWHLLTYGFQFEICEAKLGVR